MLLDDSRLDEGSDELLHEERVPLGTPDDQIPEIVRKLDGEQLPQHPRRGLGGKRLEPDGCRISAAAAPAGTAIEQLWPSRREQDDRCTRVTCDALEEVEEVVFGPVNVLDEHDHRHLGCDVLDEAHDRLV